MAKAKTFRFCIPAKLYITVPDVTAEDAAEQLKDFLREYAADGVPVTAYDDDDVTRSAIVFPDDDAVDALSSDDLEEEESDSEDDEDEIDEEEG